MPRAGITPLRRDARLEVRVQFVRTIGSSRYTYNYEFFTLRAPLSRLHNSVLLRRNAFSFRERMVSTCVTLFGFDLAYFSRVTASAGPLWFQRVLRSGVPSPNRILITFSLARLSVARTSSVISAGLTQQHHPQYS